MAVNNTNTFTNHTGNGTEVNFAISFSYISILGITVTIDEVVKTIDTDYTITGQQLTFVTAPANGVAIKFQRNTDISLPVVDFQDGSVLTELDLDTGLRQVLFAQQENADDAAAGSVPDGEHLTANGKRIGGVETPVSDTDVANKAYTDLFLKRDGSLPLTGEVNSGGNKITNLGDATNANDAVTKGQLDAGIGNAQSAVTTSTTKAQEASDSADDAQGFANEAKGYRDEANVAKGIAQNLARVSVFLGFKREDDGMLVMEYSTAGDQLSPQKVYKTEDYYQNGASHAFFLGEDILNSNGIPAISFQPTGNLILDI